MADNNGKPKGSITFISFDKPSISDGVYELSVSQSFAVGTGAIAAKDTAKKIKIAALGPRFSLDPQQVVGNAIEAAVLQDVQRDALAGPRQATDQNQLHYCSPSGSLPFMPACWRARNSAIESMPRSLRISLRTAASTSTARLRPAATGMITLRTVTPRISSESAASGRRSVGIARAGGRPREVRDQPQLHLAAHRGLAEDGADVEQAEAAHLDEVLQHGRAAALERAGRDARDLDHVVGHQAVAAADQLEPELALAYARFAGDEHAEAEHVHEHAVALGALGERLGEVARQLLDHARRRQRRGEQRRMRARRARSPAAGGGATPSATITRCGVRLEQPLDVARRPCRPRRRRSPGCCWDG